MTTQGPKPSTLLFWLGLTGWILLLAGPFLHISALLEQLVGFPLTGLNWVPVLFIAYWNAPAWELGTVLVGEYVLLLAVGGVGVYWLGRGNRIGFRVLLACGVLALAAYPGLSVGPSLMVAVGVAGIIGLRNNGPL